MHKRLFTNSTGFVKYTTNKSRFMTGKKKKKKNSLRYHMLAMVISLLITFQPYMFLLSYNIYQYSIQDMWVSVLWLWSVFSEVIFSDQTFETVERISLCIDSQRVLSLWNVHGQLVHLSILTPYPPHIPGNSQHLSWNMIYGNVISVSFATKSKISPSWAGDHLVARSG